MGACGGKEAVNPLDAPEDAELKPEFVPTGSIAFPDVEGMRKEKNTKERERRDQTRALLKEEKGLEFPEEVPAEPVALAEEADALDAPPVDDVELVVEKVKHEDDSILLNEDKDFEREVRFKEELEEAKEEQIRALREDAEAEAETEDMPVLISELEVEEETVDETGETAPVRMVHSTKIDGIIKQLEADEGDDVATAEDVLELDEDTKALIAQRRQKFQKHKKELPTGEIYVMNAPTSRAQRLTAEEFEEQVVDFLRKDEEEFLPQGLGGLQPKQVYVRKGLEEEVVEEQVIVEEEAPTAPAPPAPAPPAPAPPVPAAPIPAAPPPPAAELA